ncbi:MAG: DoxX family protein [Alphaproteobacteria bacterium]|nr:DoxX family protein [Alphaproteobacteria bacterium]
MNKAILFYTQRVLPALNNLSSLPVLGLRLWIADVFFQSGHTKLLDWQGTVALFADEYKVPVLPPEIAASLGTATELVAPVLLAIGLGGRFAACAMLFMTGVIEFTYMHFDVHVIWALTLALIILQGPGKLSLDYLLRKRFG